MPLYDFACELCGYNVELQLPISDFEKPEKEPCPCCSCTGSFRQRVGANPFIDSVRLGIRQPDRTFQREVLGRMQKNIRRNKIGQGRFTIPGREG
jgi:putative FmdB family regulatory protein